MRRLIVILFAVISAIISAISFVPGILPPIIYAQSNDVLQVATVERTPFVVKRGTGYIGYSIELWDEVAKEIGVEYELTVFDTFPAMLDSVKSKEMDLAVANITITADREKELDFSHPIYFSGLQIMLARSGKKEAGQFVQAIFDSGILWAIGGALLILFVVANLIWLFEQGDEREFHNNYLEGIWDAFWWSAVTVTTVGYGDKVPRSTPGRILALIWMFFSLFLLSIFVAQISNIMTDTVFSVGIEGPADLAGKSVVTVEQSTAHHYLDNINAVVVGYTSPDEMFAALEAGEGEAAVFDAPVMAYYEATAGEGKVKLVGPIFKPEQFGIALQSDSPYRETINLALLQLTENGTTQAIYNEWFGGINQAGR